MLPSACALLGAVARQTTLVIIASTGGNVNTFFQVFLEIMKLPPKVTVLAHPQRNDKLYRRIGR